MRGVSLFLIVGLTAGWGAGQFLNNRPFPTYSLESMPDTDFTCRDKILGGYYADSQTQCQMFHICVKVPGVGVQDFRFLCPNGTAFDQDHQICAEWDDVDCDATTLYYASDNFDLYRIGSGFESKAVKYGEDEETFSLQRAETGDARLNREHQAQRVNQQKDFNTAAAARRINNNNNNYNNNNNERDIFKTSSSSNFFNNRNGGKEVDDDEDDANVNVNQNRDAVQKRKLVRKQQRRPQEQQQNYQQQQPQQQNQQRQQQQQQQRPQQQQQQQQPRPQQQQQQQRPQQQQQQPRPQQQQQQQQQRPQQQQQQQKPLQQQKEPQRIQQQQRQQPVQQQPQPQPRPQQPQQNQQRPQQQQQFNSQKTQTTQQQNLDTQTNRPSRPTGFVNNFAGSSYVPTTARTTQTANTDYTEPQNTGNFQRIRNSQRRPNNNQNKQYNDAENFRGNNQQTQSTSFSISTPAPFRQTQQFTKTTPYDDGQYRPTTPAPKPFNSQQTENYPAPFNKQNYQAAQQKPAPFKNAQQENYPTTPVARNTGFDNHYDVPKIKSTTKQTDNYPSTYTPKQKKIETVPTTYAPKTNFGTTQFHNQPSSQNINNQPTTQQFTQPPTAPGHSRPFANQFNAQKQTQPPTSNSTPKTTPFTQYTPTVPKITSTTPVSRSNRFDETQYDDGSYNSKYETYEDANNNKEDEFLKTAHSQNIASSRNEYAKNTKKTTPASTQKPFYSESPRPFSTSANTPRITDYPKTTKQATPKPAEQPKQAAPKKSNKNASYDYAYYDTSVGNDPEYDIETDFKKTS